ncbi:MAG: hypothetical protein ISQ06_09605 [Planctomycetaceae bacterium]|nr:hypothetical protein [Planctomycetaceae bacterium]
MGIPSTMILPAGASTASLGGFALAGLARAATDNEAERVYSNSVDDARKVLADDRAQAAVDEALADFDQAIIDLDAEALESEPIELPELLKYQKRDDEPEVSTYELYEEGTIQGDRDWHEQGFNPAPDPGPGFIFRNRIDHRRRCGISRLRNGSKIHTPLRSALRADSKAVASHHAPKPRRIMAAPASGPSGNHARASTRQLAPASE